jgi:hypothetical protein
MAADLCRQSKPTWQQLWQQGITYRHRHPQCRPQFLLVLLATHRVHGLWRGEADPRQDHDLRAHLGGYALCLWCHLRNHQLGSHARRGWTHGASCHYAARSKSDGILCLDAELA